MIKRNNIDFMRISAYTKSRKICIAIVLGFCIALIPLLIIMSSKTAMTDEVELVCETEEHVHVEECYSIEYTCEIEESDTEHLHSEDCFSEEAILTCEITEIIPHTHTEDCSHSVQICDLIEHTHVEECIETYDLNTETVLQTTSNTVETFAFDGEGTASAPYVIASHTDLLQLAEAVNTGDANYNTKSYILGADIDLSAYNSSNAFFNNGKGWIPIGTAENPFSGTFNGNGYGISGLYIYDSSLDYAGLFGYIQNGQIHHVGLEGVIVSANSKVGGLVGYINSGTITNCYSICWTSGISDVGGLIGYIANGVTVSNCYSTKPVNATIGNAGGIVGGVEHSGTNLIETCYSTGDVIGSDTQDNYGVGGIIGNKNDSITIKNCVALSAKVNSSTLDNSNRIVSFMSGGNIVNCYAFSGMISGHTNPAWPATPEVSNSSARGGNISANDLDNVNFWTSNIGFDGAETWTLSQGNLPILDNVGGIQSSTKPLHLNGTAFSGGNGTSEDPWVITTAEQLAWLSERVLDEDVIHTGTSGANQHYILGNNIDLSMYDEKITNSKGKGWVPIGDSSSASAAFKGNFDGNGKTINGLYIDRSNYTSGGSAYSGLFGYAVGATIKNLGVINVNINGRIQTGAIAGSIGHGATIENCYSTGSITGYQAVGGIVGVIYNTSYGINTITKCYSTADVTAENFRAGGIAGTSTGLALISNCYSTGDISSATVTGIAQAGGILGCPTNNSTVTIANCYVTGNISSADLAGGIVSGNEDGYCHITNSAVLSLGVRGISDSKRIKSGNYNATLASNRAYDGMKNFDDEQSWNPKGTTRNENGEDMSAKEALTANFWSDEMDWDGDTIWQLKDGKLPILAGLAGQNGKSHFDEDWILGIAKINLEKIILGENPPPDKDFTFKLTEVDAKGNPVTPPFEMEMTKNSAGKYYFEVPMYEEGLHYFKITEQPGINDGWKYDSSEHLVEVYVASDYNNTITTSLDGDSETYFNVKYGNLITTHAKPNPPVGYNITPERRYQFIGTGYTNYIVTDGSKNFFGLCADFNLRSPSSSNHILQKPSNGDRNNSVVALAAALGVSSSGGFQNGTGLTESEYESLFGITPSSYNNRRISMQELVWHYESNERLSSDHTKLKNTLEKMIEASKNIPAEHSITSLSLEYNKTTGKITFNHEGYQPLVYDTYLSWRGDTEDLIVTVNGKTVDSGVAIEKTDNISAIYNGNGKVEFFITDNQLYLKAGSVKGSILKNISDSRVQPCILGTAEFVKIKNSFEIEKYTSETKPHSLTFVNEFNELPSTSVEIVGNKTITGIDSTDEEFLFRLTQVTDIGGATNTAPLFTQTCSVVGAGEFSFNIENLYPGSYFYKIEEVTENPAEGWTYDNFPKMIHVNVNNDSVPIVTITYPHGGLTFDNSYKQPGLASAIIKGEKIVNGIENSDQAFAFSLEQVADEDGLIPYEDGVPHMDSEVTFGAGTFEFEINDLAPGIYYYKIFEVMDDANNGWSYDNTVYVAIVSVTDTGEEDYAVDISYKSNNSTPEKLQFKNSFTPLPSADVEIHGTKDITGFPHSNQEFKFLLERVSDATGSELVLPMYSKVSTTTGADNFSFIIEDLLPNTYFFRISEDASNPVAGWQYDQNVYIVSVTVADDLEVTVSYPEENDAVRFINKFHANGLLPKTGGIGTTPFHATAVILGAILIALASGAFIHKRRDKKSN